MVWGNFFGKNLLDFGVSRPLPGWFGALFPRWSAPERPFECGQYPNAFVSNFVGASLRSARLKSITGRLQSQKLDEAKKSRERNRWNRHKGCLTSHRSLCFDHRKTSKLKALSEANKLLERKRNELDSKDIQLNISINLKVKTSWIVFFFPIQPSDF